MGLGRRMAGMLLAVLIALPCSLGACSDGRRSPGGPSGPVEISDEIAESPYDWDCLRWDERGRVSYVVDGTVRSRTGIDVSEHNYGIDWDAVAADGIDFAYIRAAWRGSTEGGLYADERFEENLSGAQAAGLDAGLYVFSQAMDADEGREEAEFVLGLLDGRALELPIAFDHETTADYSGRSDSISRDDYTAAAQAFCETIEAAGYRALIYGNSHEFSRLDILAFQQRGYWLAEYDEAPSVPLDLVMWQYTGQGSVDGIQTSVDMDIELATVLDD